jgi:hypothetical protein
MTTDGGCPNGACEVRPQGKLSDPATVAARRAMLIRTHPLMCKRVAEATPCDPQDAIKDLKALINRLDITIFEILQMKEQKEADLLVLEGQT